MHLSIHSSRNIALVAGLADEDKPNSSTRMCRLIVTPTNTLICPTLTPQTSVPYLLHQSLIHSLFSSHFSYLYPKPSADMDIYIVKQEFYCRVYCALLKELNEEADGHSSYRKLDTARKAVIRRSEGLAWASPSLIPTLRRFPM